MLRGFLVKLVATEMHALEDARRGAVYWPRRVEIMRKEVKAYKNLFSDGPVQKFVQRETGLMWQRVLNELTGENKKLLQETLEVKTTKLVEMQERDPTKDA
jgi:hypothetical protein